MTAKLIGRSMFLAEHEDEYETSNPFALCTTLAGALRAVERHKERFNDEGEWGAWECRYNDLGEVDSASQFPREDEENAESMGSYSVIRMYVQR